MKKIAENILITSFFFLALVFIFTLSRGDTFVNYGFSYAISKGEIPYKDFNLVIPLFGPFIYSIGLLMYQNIITIYLEQAIMLTVFFKIVKKMIGERSILFLLFLLLPYPIAIVSVIFPGYNFLILFLFILFLYCYKKEKNEIILGTILGLIFCTKQTIGLILFLPTFYYLLNNKKKFLKMLIGYIIPIVIMIIYLLCTKSFSYFLDLCILGLFDFGTKNQQIDIYYLILLIIGIIYLLYRIFKDKKNILNYYALVFASVTIPIIDYYHVSLFLVVIFFFLIENITWNIKYNKYILLFIFSLNIIWCFVSYYFLEEPLIQNNNHFSLVINRKSYVTNSDNLLKYINTLDREVIYFMRGSENYYYKIINNKKINYFDLPNYGNYGYNGIEKMKNKITETKNVYYVLDRELLSNKDKNQQYIKELGKYVINKSNKVKSIGIYDIYYKE